MDERRPQTGHLSRLQHLWRRHGWVIIGLLWAVAFILAFTGFARNAQATGRPATPFDLAYLALQLIPLGSGAVQGPVSWELQVARFLIPFLAAWTAIFAFLSLFRDRWQQLLLRLWRGHVIICGLSRKGWLLAQGFAARGNRIVVIEAQENHDLIGPCHERGIVTLTGDATDPDLLRRAGVLHAAHLVAVTDDDGVNVEIAVRSQGVLREAARTARDRRFRAGSLTCTVHLVDPRLHELARTRELALEVGVPFRLELFNVFERGARLLWSTYGPGPGTHRAPASRDGQVDGCSSHVVVFGLGSLGESLVVRAARDWHAGAKPRTSLHRSPSAAAGRLHITVVDLEAGWKCRALHLRYPHLADVCDLVPLTMNVHGPEFYEAAFLTGSLRGPPGSALDSPPISAVFICFDDDSLGLRTGLAVHQHMLHASASPMPIVVRMAEAGGLARLVDPDGDGRQGYAFANLHAFGLLSCTCTPETILDGTHEVLARGLHEAYVRQQEALGQTAAADRSLAEWDRLPEALLESNRAQADTILHQLAGLGYGLIPLADLDAGYFRFPEPEIERLAEREHDRFVAERRSQGWRYDRRPKSIAAGLSPALRPWSELPEEERTKTRAFIRELPATLARAGFQIVRLAPADQQGAAILEDKEEPLMEHDHDTREVLACAIHERYRRNQHGIKPPDDPAMQPWEALPEHLRESNRQQADDIEATLQRIGCGVRPATGRAPAPLVFTDAEVEVMAGAVHEHWVAERRSAGWVAGSERDIARRGTPHLAPYADLPDDVKEWDRQAVRAISEVLAAAGLEAHR